MCLSIALFVASASDRAYADVKGNIDLGSVKIEGLRVGIHVVIDKAFAEKHKIESYQTPFEYFLPKRKHIFVENHGKTPSFVKYSFATPSKELISNVQFTNMTVPEGDTKQRVAVVKKLLLSQVLPTLGGNPVAHAVYQTKVGEFDAVCLDAEIADPTLGKLFVKVTGYLKPGSTHAILGVGRYNPKHSQVKKAADLRDKGLATRVLYSFRYQ